MSLRRREISKKEELKGTLKREKNSYINVIDYIENMDLGKENDVKADPPKI